MSGRKLNVLEQKIHQTALASEDKVRKVTHRHQLLSFEHGESAHYSQTLSQKELDALSPDVSSRTSALNFLLGAGLLKVLKNEKGKLSFRAVVKQELEVYVFSLSLVIPILKNSSRFTSYLPYITLT